MRGAKLVTNTRMALAAQIEEQPAKDRAGFHV